MEGSHSCHVLCHVGAVSVEASISASQLCLVGYIRRMDCNWLPEVGKDDPRWPDVAIQGCIEEIREEHRYHPKHLEALRCDHPAEVVILAIHEQPQIIRKGT